MPDGAYISAVMFLFLRLVLKVKNSLGLVGDVTLHAALEYAKIVSIFPYLPLRDALADLCLQYKSVRVL